MADLCRLRLSLKRGDGSRVSLTEATDVVEDELCCLLRGRRPRPVRERQREEVLAPVNSLVIRGASSLSRLLCEMDACAVDKPGLIPLDCGIVRCMP